MASSSLPSPAPLPSVLRILTLVLFCLATCFPLVIAKSATGARTLVVLNSAEEESKYSTFLGSLRARGFDLILTSAADKNALVKYEERIYDNLLVLAHSAASLGGITPAAVVDFQKRGGNVLVAGSSSVSETIRDIAVEYSVEFDEKSFVVQDDFSHLDNDPTLVLTSRFVGPAGAISEQVKQGKPVIYRGNGARLTGRNKLATTFLSGTATSFSWPIGSKKPLDKFAIVGSGLSLVSALQTRGNARIVFSGSADIFSDELLNKKLADGSSNGNFAFITDVSKWVFQEKGVLKIKSTSHHRENEDRQHGAYRIKDDMVFRIEISEYNENSWRPFQATDIQFEAVMLDPYVRANLTQAGTSSDAGIFEVRFRLPDVYGVFTFKVDYRRHGYSWIESKETVAVHPFRHNEYPRFLTPAFPYYVNSFSMILAFFALSVVVLYHSAGQGKVAGKGKEKEKVA
ncbi:hypothetical protein HDU67_008642 [Dinochytrium kinnereticum]|nr:hypothetical protein HDU67_008642 [Dinochytrium kinnereticum]